MSPNKESTETEDLGVLVHTDSSGAEQIFNPLTSSYMARVGYMKDIDLASACKFLQIPREKASILPSVSERGINFVPISDAEWDKTSPKWAESTWKRVEAALHQGVDRMLLYGPPGVGKSYTPFIHARDTDKAFFSVTMTEMTPMSELRGHFVLKDGGTIWHDGICSRVWRTSQERPVVFVINEIDQSGMDAMTFLHNFLDDQEIAAIYLPTGEKLQPAPGKVQVIATMNGIPGDLSSALQDRFAVRQAITAPHPDALSTLPGWASKWVSKVYKEAKTVPSYRQVKQLVDLLNKGFPPSAAAALIFSESTAHEVALSVMAGLARK